MKKTIVLCVVLLLAGCSSLEEGNFRLSTVANSEQATMRLGVIPGQHTEVGVLASYFEQLDEEEAISAGMYSMWETPDVNIPLNDLLPQWSLPWLPEFVSITPYLGGSIELEFHSHEILANTIVGARIGPVGLEWQHSLTGNWNALATVEDQDRFMLVLKGIRF